MGNRKGHSETQSIEEMLEGMNEAKEKNLSARKNIYKVESGEHLVKELQKLSTDKLNEIVAYATKERVALENLEEIQKRTVLYMRACIESGTFPNSLGLARSLGYSDRALRHWRSKQSQTPTAKWLEMCNDTFADILAQSALKNNSNVIMSIFIQKSLYDFRETSEIVLTPHTVEMEENNYSAEEIRKRYLPPMRDEAEE